MHSQNSRASLLGASYDPSFRHDTAGFREREGYVDAPQRTKRRRIYVPNSLWTWSFVIVTLIQTIITLALEWYAKQPCYFSSLVSWTQLMVISVQLCFRKLPTPTQTRSRRCHRIQSHSNILSLVQFRITLRAGSRIRCPAPEEYNSSYRVMHLQYRASDLRCCSSSTDQGSCHQRFDRQQRH